MQVSSFFSHQRPQKQGIHLCSWGPVRRLQWFGWICPCHENEDEYLARMGMQYIQRHYYYHYSIFMNNDKQSIKLESQQQQQHQSSMRIQILDRPLGPTIRWIINIVDNDLENAVLLENMNGGCDDHAVVVTERTNNEKDEDKKDTTNVQGDNDDNDHNSNHGMTTSTTTNNEKKEDIPPPNKKTEKVQVCKHQDQLWIEIPLYLISRFEASTTTTHVISNSNSNNNHDDTDHDDTDHDKSTQSNEQQKRKMMTIHAMGHHMDDDHHHDDVECLFQFSIPTIKKNKNDDDKDDLTIHDSNENDHVRDASNGSEQSPSSQQPEQQPSHLRDDNGNKYYYMKHQQQQQQLMHNDDDDYDEIHNASAHPIYLLDSLNAIMEWDQIRRADENDFLWRTSIPYTNAAMQAQLRYETIRLLQNEEV